MNIPQIKMINGMTVEELQDRMSETTSNKSIFEFYTENGEFKSYNNIKIFTNDDEYFSTLKAIKEEFPSVKLLECTLELNNKFTIKFVGSSNNIKCTVRVSNLTNSDKDDTLDLLNFERSEL